jgi:hypothetical protein
MVAELSKEPTADYADKSGFKMKVIVFPAPPSL